MRQVLIGLVALVIGFLLGGIGPRAQLRTLEASVDHLAEEKCEKTVGRDLAAMFGAARRNNAGSDKPYTPPARFERVQGEPEGEVEPALVEPEEATEPVDPAERMEDELEMARTALDLRRTQAMAALIEDADPSDEQLDAIDAAVDQMNVELEDLAADLISLVNSGEEPSRSEMMIFAADALDVMITAEESIAGQLSDDQLASVEDGSVDPFSYVDPGLVDLFYELDQSALE